MQLYVCKVFEYTVSKSFQPTKYSFKSIYFPSACSPLRLKIDIRYQCIQNQCKIVCYFSRQTSSSLFNCFICNYICITFEYSSSQQHTLIFIQVNILPQCLLSSTSQNIYECLRPSYAGLNKSMGTPTPLRQDVFIVRAPWKITK